MKNNGSVTRVLHVDDEDQRRTVTKRILEDVGDGMAVVTESSADDGLARLAEGDVDCVVSDYAMPGTNGIEFLKAVREEFPDLPFILFTGKGSEEIASEAISAGVTDYLQKGSGVDGYRILANRVRNAVAKRDAEREAEQVHRAMEAAQEGISLLDEDGYYTYVNQAYADLYGYEPEEMVGEHFELIYPEWEVDRVYDDILPAVSEHETWRGETTGLRSDGTTFLEDHSLVEREDGGLVCAIRDATGRGDESGEHATLTTEVLDTSDVGTVVIDADAAIVWVNEAVEEYFGLDRSEILGADHPTVIREQVKEVLESPERFAEGATGYADSTDAERFECRVRDTDRTDARWLERWTQSIESGPFAGGRIVHHKDITERKRREEELRRQNAQLEEFASVLSHDLRNPLGIAQTYVELLSESDEVGEEALSEIEQAHDRIENIIEDVLTLARDGESVENAAPVELAALAEDAWANVETDNATLRTDAEGAVVADEVRTKRLFENLFHNAVEHGGTDVTVTVEDLPDGFSVADDGRGISAEAYETMFESAYTTTEGGNGLGLSIVQQIAYAHGWTVDATESEAGGVQFEFRNVERDGGDVDHGASDVNDDVPDVDVHERADASRSDAADAPSSTDG